MTSLATIAGALPAALALGPGAEVRQPMAVAVLGGVAVSTVLTLFVVPALYSLFDALTSRFVTSGAHAREAAKALADLDAEKQAAFGHPAPPPNEPVSPSA
jgi:hypothetical protein